MPKKRRPGRPRKVPKPERVVVPRQDVVQHRDNVARLGAQLSPAAGVVGVQLATLDVLIDLLEEVRDARADLSDRDSDGDSVAE